MADIILRRNFTPGNKPSTASLGVAQIAVNVPDGKAFLRKSGSGVDQINEIVTTYAQGSGSIFFTGSVYVYQEVSGTNIYGTASFADTASYTAEANNARNVLFSGKANMALTKGQVVRVAGANGANVLIETASYIDDPLSSDTIGVALTSAALNATVEVLTQGVISGINTNAFNVGDNLYLGANGALTNVAPQAPLHTVRMGVVTRKNASTGEAFIIVRNGYELGESHDVVDSTTTSSFGDVLVKSGSVWINSKNLTGSYSLSGSISLFQSTSVSGTNVFGTASWADRATSASFVESRINREWHVSSGSGDDTTGDGSLLKPFRTLARASSSLGNTGERIILHPGTYRESVTFPQLNFSISTPGDTAPGEIYVSGTITLTGGSSSNKLGGFVVNSLVQSGNASLYLQSMTVIGSTTKSGTGYFEVQNTGLSQNSTITISNSGTCVFQTCKVGIINQSHASSVVSILNCMTVVFPTATAGTALIKDSVVYSTASGSAACSYGASSVVFLQNSSFYNPLGQNERVILSGLHGFDDCIFNRENSTFGSSLVARPHFQHLQATALTGSGLLVTNETVLRGNIYISSSGMVPGSSEGGQLNFALAPATSSLTGSVVMDIWQNRLRIFEEGGNNRGGYFDISALANGVGTNLAAGGGSGVATIVSASAPPATSVSGTLWFNTLNGDMYVQTASPTGSIWTPIAVDLVTGSVTASVHHRDGFTVNSIMSGSTFSGSIQVISGSIFMRDSSSAINIFGTASNAHSASYAEYTTQAPTLVSATTPTTRSSGSLWWNTDDGNLYVQVETHTGSEWVPAVNSTPGGNFGATVDFPFATGATTWNINHNFGTTTPIVQVYSGSQMILPATVRAVDANNLQLTFATLTHGVAKVSTGVGSATSASFAPANTTAFIDGGAITIGATTTAPTKGSMVTDRVYYRQKGPKVWEVVYNWYNNSGGTAGTGDYLLTLPAGLQFNSAALGQTFNTTATSTGLQLNFGLGTAPAMMNTTLPMIFAFPWDATRFRIFIHNPSLGQFIWGSGYAALTQLSIFKLQFEFTAL